MACPLCGRATVAGSCVDGFVAYLSGDYGCPFNPASPPPRNLRELAPLEVRRREPKPAMSAEGLEDLL